MKMMCRFPLKSGLFFSCLFSPLYITNVCGGRVMENRALSKGMNSKWGLWINLKHQP